MAEVQEKVQEKLSAGAGNTALKAAAAAAATTAATYALRRMRSHDHGGGGTEPSGDERSNGSSKAGKGSFPSSLLVSAAATSWDAASDVLLPFADDAAEGAGKYVATHGPEILRERIVPKFIEAFDD